MNLLNTCSVEYCERVHYAKGFCRAHYARFKAGKDINVLIRGREKTCKVQGCKRPQRLNGFCITHNQRIENGVPLRKPIRFKSPVLPVDKRKLRQTYNNMKQRCYNKNHKFYRYYGARGIEVCERWKIVNGYINFIEDMGEKPEASYSIDRIDNNGNYEPGNCRWATKKEQRHNQRPHVRTVK